MGMSMSVSLVNSDALAEAIAQRLGPYLVASVLAGGLVVGAALIVAAVIVRKRG